MCGICGVAFEHGAEGNLGVLLSRMADAQQIRAQDSAGATLYSHDKKKHPVANIIRALEKGDGHSVQTIEYIMEQIILDSAERQSELDTMVQDPSVHIASIGYHMEIFKGVGLAKDVASTYSIPQRRGTHGNAHIRIATVAQVSPFTAHPFGTVFYKDLSGVHNGEITNYGKLRKLLELRGHHFQTNNDSELAVIYAADQLEQHGDLEKALNVMVYGDGKFMPGLSGPYSIVICTDDAIAVVRDKNGKRKAMVGIAPETGDNPSFIAITTDISALNSVGAIYDRHSPLPGKPEIYRLRQSYGQNMPQRRGP